MHHTSSPNLLLSIHNITEAIKIKRGEEFFVSSNREDSKLHWHIIFISSGKKHEYHSKKSKNLHSFCFMSSIRKKAVDLFAMLLIYPNIECTPEKSQLCVNKEMRKRGLCG